ncbi:MAG TPA: hypothetical protein DDX16_09435 [Candidatus Omnitrophica bacterium]|nr:hypothetical protein [Candidatus Omnitrophota bacterium]HBU09103.1 hypothetical protein [Candidatus Omnitrophota bacterium]
MLAAEAKRNLGDNKTIALIYERDIHGTPEENLIGKPASHGCIRMKNRDIIELFNSVKRGILIRIKK